jgi:hypothetical protein
VKRQGKKYILKFKGDKDRKLRKLRLIKENGKLYFEFWDPDITGKEFRKTPLIFASPTSAFFQIFDKVYLFSFKRKFFIDFTFWSNPNEYSSPSFMVGEKLRVEIKKRKAIFPQENKRKTLPSLFVRITGPGREFENFIIFN